MSDYRFDIGKHNGIDCLHVMIDCACPTMTETYIPIDDIQQAVQHRQSTTRRHIGVIHVDDTYVSDILNSDSTDIQGKLRDDGTFDIVHGRLQLPDSYKIVAIFCVQIYRRWNVFVESDAIPLVEPGDPQPEVEVWYQRNDDGSFRLTDIKSSVIRPALPLSDLMKRLNIQESR